MPIQLSAFDNVDLVAMVSSDFFRMDTPCTERKLYKYLNFQDLDFQKNYLRNPTLKFATKDQLNDPFDLTRRFEQFGGDLFRAFSTKYVMSYFDRHINDVEWLLDEFSKKPEFAAMGISRAQARARLSSGLGQSIIQMFSEQARQNVPALIDIAVDHANRNIDSVFDEAILNTGVLSLCEQSDNRALWSVYAGGGRGIALELNAQHEFFMVQKKDGTFRNRILKMYYRDDRIPEIWANPYYVFGVKNSDFAFEKEWRVLRPLDQCDTVDLGPGNLIHTVPAPVGLISSVIFGHRWHIDQVREIADIVGTFDDQIAVMKAEPNPSTGAYEVGPIV